jgi:hypothetical protein
MAADEDNEPTGIHMSDGDVTIGGLLGQRIKERPGETVLHSTTKRKQLV